MTGDFRAFFACFGMVLCAIADPAASEENADSSAALEDRIAQLEEVAASARTRGKQVSLRIAGLVDRAILHWNDGGERNTYVVTNDNIASRFTFSASIKLNNEWKAGYYLDLGAYASGTFFINQNSDIFEDLRVRYSFAYLQSERLGRVAIGQFGGASSDLAAIGSAVTADLFSFYGQVNVGAAMNVRADNGRLSSLTWSRLIRERGAAPGEGGRANVVRYDTPTMAGFRATVAWGEDDFWDVGLRFTKQFGDLLLDAFLIYDVNTETGDGSAIACLTTQDQVLNSRRDARCRQGIAIASLTHVPTGIYTKVALGRFHDDMISATTAFAGTEANKNSDFWAAEVGIAHKWLELGKTTVFGQHYEFRGGANARRYIDAADAANPFGVDSRLSDTGVKSWGGGVIQNISEADMDLFVFYRRLTATAHIMEGTSGAGVLAAPTLKPLEFILTGAIIRF